MTKETLVILHGWGLSKKKFEPLIDACNKRGFDAVALDFPGFGNSEIPKHPMNLTDYAHFLYGWLQKEKITHPIFIGHSFGGRVSLRYHSLYPKSVRTLILTGTPGYSPVKRGKFYFFVLFGKIGKWILSLPGLSMFHEKIQNKYYMIIGAREFSRASGPMKQTFKNIVTDSLVDDMRGVTIPCHLIWGEHDRIVPVSIARKMQSVIPHATLDIILDTDHGVPFKAPEIFAQAIERYLNKIR